MGRNECMNSQFIFFIGTEAELIKLFPIIRIMEDRGIGYVLIASGQNSFMKSRVLGFANNYRVDIILSNEMSIKKNAVGLLQWYIKTRKKARKMMEERFDKQLLRNKIMIVHGDTVSSVMGAYLGKHFGMRVAHVEAGLRSFHWLNPFPEEIDRMLVSRIATIHFAPGIKPYNNLSKKNYVFNTLNNTLIDSLSYADSVECDNQIVNRLIGTDYFVLVLHRQENIHNTALVKAVIKEAERVASYFKCVLLLHKITEVKLKEMNVLKSIREDERFILLPRMDYFNFMKLLKGSQFVITDGGSNQEELSYMGKPSFILRKTTERDDGLGKNAVISGDKDPIEAMRLFVSHYHNYETDFTSVNSKSPSEMIIDKLLEVI